MSLNPDAGRLIALVEKQTGYRVTLGTTEVSHRAGFEDAETAEIKRN